jgi:hypothetical protein
MVELNKGLDGFLHSLIPARLRESLVVNSAEYIRARALAVGLIVSTAVPALATVVIGSHHLLFEQHLLKHDLVSLVIAILFGLQAVFYCRFGNQWLSSAAFTNMYFILLALLIITSGGITSPMKAIMVTCPIMSFLIGGKEEGLQNTLITILFILGLVALSVIEFELPNLFHEESPQMIFVVNWVGTIIIIAACSTVYEVELMGRSGKPNTSRNAMRKSIGNLNERFDAFVHGLIPAKLRQALDRQSGGYVRVRTLSVMLVTATLMSAVSAVILVFVHFLFFREQLKYDFVILAITFIFGVQTWAFYKFTNFWLSSLLISYFYFIVVLTLISISGGYEAPTMVLALVSPLIFFMLGGLRRGLQNSVFVMMIGVFFGAMSSIGFEFPNVFDAASPILTYSIAFVIAIISIALSITVYDTELEKIRG